MAFLVNKTKDTAQQVLYKQLYEVKDVMDLMGEDPLIEESRKECSEALEKLRQALESTENDEALAVLQVIQNNKGY